MVFKVIFRPPCPTYQLWPSSSVKENHPKMPIWDPRNEFPGVPWVGLFSWHSYILLRKEKETLNFPEFASISLFFGVPKSRFGGR